MNRTFAALLFLVMCVFPASLFSNTIYFPQVAFGGGYSTTFVIINTGAANVSARLNFYSQAGVSRSDLNTQVNVAAGNSTRLTLPNTGPLSVVWAELVAGSGTVQGVATFDLRDNNGVLTTSAGVLGIEGGNSFLVPVDVTAVGSTGIAIGNTSSAPVNVGLRLLGENGAQVAASTDLRFIPLASHGQVADFVTNIFPQLAGTTFKGTLVIDAPSGTAAGALAATALSVKEGLLSALPVIAGGSAGATTLDFPQVAFGGGYSTTFTILNVGAPAVTSTLRFYDQTGFLRTDLGTSINISPNGSARFTLPNSGQLSVVWGELVATIGSVQGVAAFDLRADNGTLTTSAGVLGVQPGNGFTVPVDVTPSGATGIAIANTKDSTVGLRIRLFGENGSEVATANAARFTSLAGRGQLADFVTTAFPSLAGTTFKGSLSVEASAGAPTGSLAATALSVKEGLLSALPVIPGAFSGAGGTGGTPGSGASSACFNPLPYTSAFGEHLEYVLSGALVGTYVADDTSTLNVLFESQPLTEIRAIETTTVIGRAPFPITTRSYYRLEGTDILTHGVVIGSSSSGSKLVYSPPARDKRFSLPVGGTDTQTYTTTTTATRPGLPTVTTSETTTDTFRYLGRETITVPAGTFETCKFEENGDFAWIAAGNSAGLRVKSIAVADDLTLELKSGTVNGAPIKP